MTHPTRDLEEGRDLIVLGIADADKAVVAHGDGIDEGVRLDDLLQVRADLAAASQDLMDVRHALDTLIGEVMGRHSWVLPGFGQVERHKRKARTQWDKDLYRLVLDTVLVDPDTGEITPESESDKIRAVWNLAAPRLTVLKARGIDPDEWCSVEERPGWDIRIGG